MFLVKKILEFSSGSAFCIVKMFCQYVFILTWNILVAETYFSYFIRIIFFSFKPNVFALFYICLISFEMQIFSGVKCFWYS